MLTLMISLALSTATAEAPTNPPATETAAKPEKTKPKLVCRRIADTGSRLPERECRTQEDWDRQADSINKRLNNDK
ncbi:hypothetical protein [Sphingopyxis sp.]|uniref:hypothetical protein n=1 Tax=Sphingopyxis sp. TaxID=1908224 RepID=UPI003D1260BA